MEQMNKTSSQSFVAKLMNSYVLSRMSDQKENAEQC